MRVKPIKLWANFFINWTIHCCKNIYFKCYQNKHGLMPWEQIVVTTWNCLQRADFSTEYDELDSIRLGMSPLSIYMRKRGCINALVWYSQLSLDNIRFDSLSVFSGCLFQWQLLICFEDEVLFLLIIMWKLNTVDAAERVTFVWFIQ